MKLGQKGNQASLIILHEFPGHMIKVKGHLGSTNLEYAQFFLKFHHNLGSIWTYSAAHGKRHARARTFPRAPPRVPSTTSRNLRGVDE